MDSIEHQKDSVKKYRIRDDGRIEALRPGPWGGIGTVGGFISAEHNLGHDDHCWVYGDARVYENAQVYGDARVCDDARVYGDARLHGAARVYENAHVYENAQVCDDARVYGGARVRGAARVLCDVPGGALEFGTHQWVAVWCVADGYSKLICEIDGVAWIGAGCRWFTLADAIRHWATRTDDRKETIALLQGAIALADQRGLRHE